MTNAYLGLHFVPTLGVDSRVVTVAAHDRVGYVFVVPALFGRHGL